ncbi:MAG: Methylase involved in ubiquinone/menaquinone biosynthesis [Chthonomonadaceae bacterium]|nr:Methylase involved in ubiquinone/menaquinone biosynthesis [Chthonomonadaceae bacterium]
MNEPEYERMYRLEDSYWWFVGRHRLVEALLHSRYGAPGTQDAVAPLNILDVGCGTGAMSVRLTRWGRVVSADFSHTALEFSRRRGLDHLVGADAMKLPFAADRFDAVVTMDVLEHLPDDCAAMREFFRVLKPGGRVFATIPAYPHLWSEHDLALMHFRRYRLREVRERFEAAGFRIEKLSHTMTALYPIVALQRRLNARKPPHDPPQAAMPIVPAPLNAALTGFLSVENAFARRLNFPFGVSILCIAVKP